MFDKSTRSKQVCQLLLSLIVAKRAYYAGTTIFRKIRENRVRNDEFSKTVCFHNLSKSNRARKSTDTIARIEYGRFLL